MAVRIAALALLCLISPNPGFGNQSTSLVIFHVFQSSERQTFVPSSTNVALSSIPAAVSSTSLIRTSPVMTSPANPPVYIGNNGVASVTVIATSKKTKPNTFVSIETSVSTTASATKPPVYVEVASVTSSINHVTSMKSKPEMSVPINGSMSVSAKSLSRSTTRSQTLSVTDTTSSHLTSDTSSNVTSSVHSTTFTPTTPPPPSGKQLNYKLILIVAVPLFTVLVFVIVITMVLCIRRYRKLRRYRQHLVPLTDMDGSDDSDDEEQISDKEPVFMVSSVNSSARPILSFENEND